MIVVVALALNAIAAKRAADWLVDRADSLDSWLMDSRETTATDV
jgi:hypothetical protein